MGSTEVTRRFPWAHAALALPLALAPLSYVGAAPTPPPSLGTWANPHGSVHVRMHPCGAAMCGTVVWANEQAQVDAREGGTDKLIGARLFTGFVRDGNQRWRGKVFVPDIQRTFSGTITFTNSNTLRASGCLLGRIICRSQDWTRVRD